VILNVSFWVLWKVQCGNGKMRVQRASDGLRYGDTNKDHTLGMSRVLWFWLTFNNYPEWVATQEWYEEFNDYFRYKERTPLRGYIPDIVVYEEYFDRKIPHLFLEIDGKKHDKKSQIIKDMTCERWVKFKYFNTAPVIRFKTREMDCSEELANLYISLKLHQWCRSYSG
jgi:very-short-patch-repair endonuclease